MCPYLPLSDCALYRCMLVSLGAMIVIEFNEFDYKFTPYNEVTVIGTWRSASTIVDQQ